MKPEIAAEEAALEVLIDLEKKVRRSQSGWDSNRSEIIQTLARRNDLALMFSLTNGGASMTQVQARARTCLRRAYRIQKGSDAKIEVGVQQLRNKNFGRF